MVEGLVNQWNSLGVKFEFTISTSIGIDDWKSDRGEGSRKIISVSAWKNVALKDYLFHAVSGHASLVLIMCCCVILCYVIS